MIESKNLRLCKAICVTGEYVFRYRLLIVDRLRDKLGEAVGTDFEGVFNIGEYYYLPLGCVQRR